MVHEVDLEEQLHNVRFQVEKKGTGGLFTFHALVLYAG
jgi:hypothetical protein